MTAAAEIPAMRRALRRRRSRRGRIPASGPRRPAPRGSDRGSRPDRRILSRKMRRPASWSPLALPPRPLREPLRPSCVTSPRKRYCGADGHPTEELSADDARILAMESDALTGHTLKLLVLHPGEPLDLEALRAAVVTRGSPTSPAHTSGSTRMPRRRCGCRRTTSTIAHHVRRRAGAECATWADLLAVVDGLMSEHLDRNRPLWDGRPHRSARGRSRGGRDPEAPRDGRRRGRDASRRGDAARPPRCAPPRRRRARCRGRGGARRVASAARGDPPRARHPATSAPFDKRTRSLVSCRSPRSAVRSPRDRRVAAGACDRE